MSIHLSTTVNHTSHVAGLQPISYVHLEASQPSCLAHKPGVGTVYTGIYVQIHTYSYIFWSFGRLYIFLVCYYVIMEIVNQTRRTGLLLGIVVLWSPFGAKRVYQFVTKTKQFVQSLSLSLQTCQLLWCNDDMVRAVELHRMGCLNVRLLGALVFCEKN